MKHHNEELLVKSGILLVCVIVGGLGMTLLLSCCTSAQKQAAVAEVQKIEHGIQTFVSDVKTLDAAAVKVAPAVTKIAETIWPGSAQTVALEKATTVLTKSAGAIKSFTLTFPPQPNGTLAIAQASAAMAAQLAPQVQAIAEATAPGSSATKAIDKANIQIGTINGIIQHLVIEVPDSAQPADATPPPATTAQPNP